MRLTAYNLSFYHGAECVASQQAGNLFTRGLCLFKQRIDELHRIKRRDVGDLLTGTYELDR